MLFYLDGLKEAHERGNNGIQLQGPQRIAYSVTSQSVTLLVDVKEQKLVYHSAEVDYLDPTRPLIMVFPAEPLKHGTHYAVAVVSASDENGKRLPRTKGMEAMMKATNSEKRKHMVTTVIPALESAAEWYSFSKDPESLQLIFDFVTISETSQLGPIRAARDLGLDHVKNWNWDEHVNIVSVLNHDCCDNCFIGRTIHLSLDVPSFMHHESRYSFLDHQKVSGKKQLQVGKAKAMIQIPCSIMSGKELKAIVEFGHGLFYNRREMTDNFLQKMANKNGYIMMAMDWRGMSAFDLPIVIKTLIGEPDLFQAVRDNLIQGFVNKLCLQHFSQNGMLDLEPFMINRSRITTFEDSDPSSIFYGISQGGILGAGYVSLSGVTELIDRGVLIVPGTPFALILTRSLDFAGYDKVILLNFYNNRHTRILLTLVQMAWDSAEASGHQGRPVWEPFPSAFVTSRTWRSCSSNNCCRSLSKSYGSIHSTQ